MNHSFIRNSCLVLLLVPLFSCQQKPETGIVMTGKDSGYFKTDLSASKDPIRNRIISATNEWSKKKHEAGYMPRFSTDEDLIIPDALTHSLANDFPQYKFTIAQMGFFHWGPEKGLNLIIITDRITGNEVCHLWALWFGEDGEYQNFLKFLSHVTVTDQADAEQKIKTLAEIIALAMDGHVGKIEKTVAPDTTVAHLNDVTRYSIELFWGEGNEPWRLMKVEYFSFHQIGEIEFINARATPEELKQYLID